VRLLDEMDKPEKNSSRRPNRNQHCFPDFQCTPIHDNTADDDACALFRPIYRDAANLPEFTVPSGEDSGHNDASIEGGDSALDQSYREGFEVGQKEAHQMVQAALVPHLHNFCDAYLDLHRSLDRLLAESGKNIPTLARAIAEKILHQPVQHPLSWIDALRKDLGDALSRAYRLVIEMNPNDHHLLTCLAKDAQAVKDAEPLQFIAAHPEIPCGTVRLKRGKISLTEVDIIELINGTDTPPSGDHAAVSPHTPPAAGSRT
jgi:hypothetical protein